MIRVESLVFSPFQENTYILSDESGSCVVVDPGCLSEQENESLASFIRTKGYRPEAILFTHLHLDHVFGSRFAKEHFQVKTLAHADDIAILNNTRNYASMFGINLVHDPATIDITVHHDEEVSFGHSTLRVIHVPGHSPGSVVYYSAADGFCIVGDVLFRQSIGRTDLPGGDHQTLISGIQKYLMVLPDETVVYPGHGPSTTIGFEKENNPYF